MDDFGPLRGHGLWRYGLCPECSPKHRKRKRTLSVNTESGFAMCMRCDFRSKTDPGPVTPRSNNTMTYVERIIAECTAIGDVSAAGRYLRSRGFDPPYSGTLMAHSSLWHSIERREFPALVGVVHNVTGRIVGLHRTFLTTDGRKARVDPVRMSLGEISGGAVRIDPLCLWDGTVAFVEGIEDALGLRTLEPSWWAWACLSAPGMQAVHAPPNATRLVIGPDNDEVGARAAETLRLRLLAAGRQVTVRRPSGHDFGEVSSVSRSPR